MTRRFTFNGIMTTARLTLSVLLAATWLLIDVRSVSAEGALNVLDVQEFKRQGQVLFNAPIAVEGRLALSSKTELKFRNCEVPFRSVNGPLRLPERTTYVKVTGRPAQETLSNGKTRNIFLVEKVEAIDDDQSRYNAKASKISKLGTDPQPWYELADWARQRGTFYNDRELLARADEAFERGVRVQRRQLSLETPEALLKFADDLGTKVPESVRQSIVHEYYVRRADLARRLKAPERGQKLKELAADIRKNLADSYRPLSVFQKQTMESYRKAPEKTYEEAADYSERKQLHRYLYVDVLEEALLAEFGAAGSNGFEIAKRVDEELPERHELAESLREKALGARAKEVATLGKSEVIDLAKQYRDRNDNRMADQVIESWLTLRRRKLDSNDLDGLLDLADEYQKMLNSPAAADRMLIDAWKKHRDAPKLKERLVERGYQLLGDQWLTKLDYDSRPQARREQAIRAGDVIAGMTPAEVRLVHGEPKSIARSLSRGQVNELWTYELADSRRLVIRLTRFAFRELQVTETLLVMP